MKFRHKGAFHARLGLRCRKFIRRYPNYERVCRYVSTGCFKRALYFGPTIKTVHHLEFRHSYFYEHVNRHSRMFNDRLGHIRIIIMALCFREKYFFQQRTPSNNRTSFPRKRAAAMLRTKTKIGNGSAFYEHLNNWANYSHSVWNDWSLSLRHIILSRMLRANSSRWCQKLLSFSCIFVRHPIF